jgi:hypothetical protein
MQEVQNVLLYFFFHSLPFAPFIFFQKRKKRVVPKHICAPCLHPLCTQNVHTDYAHQLQAQMCLGFTRDILIGQLGSHEKEMQQAQMCVSFSIEA